MAHAALISGLGSLSGTVLQCWGGQRVDEPGDPTVSSATQEVLSPVLFASLSFASPQSARALFLFSCHVASGSASLGADAESTS